MPKKLNLPVDQNGLGVQTLSPVMASIVNTAIGASQVRLAIPSGAIALRISCSGACFVAFGNSSVTATSSSMGFPTGVEIFGLDPTWTHVSVLAEGASTGTFSICEMV